MNRKLVFVGFFLLAIGLFFRLYTPLIDPPLSLLGKGDPIILAHRGSRILAPENTIETFRAAIDFGTDLVETDVQLSKDFHLVHFHDDNVDRVTNGHGKVSDFTLAELKQLDAGYKFTPDNGTTFPFRGKGVRIPTPAEVFDALPNAYFNIEIKNPEPLAAEILYKIVKEKKMEKNVAVTGRWCTSLGHFRKISANDKIHTASCEGEIVPFMLHLFAGTSSVWYSLFSKFSGRSLQIPVYSGPFKLDSAAVFSTMKSLGKHVHYWVINDPEEMKRLLKLGANGIITDRVDLAVKVFEELGLKEKQDREIYKYKNIRYYVPVDTHEEVHTCVGIMCAIAHYVLSYYHYMAVAGVVLIVLLVRMCTKPTKQKKH